MFNTNSAVGRDLIEEFGIIWSQTNYVNNKYANINLEKLLNEYCELFDGKLGEYKHFEISVELNTDFKPLFRKQRTMPFALKVAI